MICGQTGENVHIFHKFLDFVAVSVFAATMIRDFGPQENVLPDCLFPPKLLAAVPHTVRTMRPAAGRPLKNEQSACTRQLHNHVQRVLLQAALAKYEKTSSAQ